MASSSQTVFVITREVTIYNSQYIYGLYMDYNGVYIVYDGIYIYTYNWLVVYLRLWKNMLVSWDDDIPRWMEK